MDAVHQAGVEMGRPERRKERMAGVVLPLFAMRTRRDWGIGQVTDLPAAAAWIRRAGHRLVQILPPHEMSAGETSPYGGLTAFGLDPIYVGVEAVEDLDAGAVDEALGHEGRDALGRVRALPAVDYAGVRALKTRVLRLAFERFHEREWLRRTARADRLAQFIERERGWLDDLALYTALRDAHGGWGWATWPEEERARSPRAMQAARADHATRLLEVAYVQWVLLDQWDAARAAMRRLDVELMGDLPFIVCAESADVWSRASQFELDASLGAPPDPYSSEGQDWGLPAYDWGAMDADRLGWVRARARRAMRLYDRFRLDHVVGYFRQWVKPKDGRGGAHFDPSDVDAQRARGRRVLQAVLEEVPSAGGTDFPRVVAEDLGVIPPFVREALADIGMPGYRVLPWERDDQGLLRDPRSLPENSVATWSTHDTAPIVAWWDELPASDRDQIARRATVDAAMDDGARSLALLGDLYGAGSRLVLVLAQELLGLRDRVNTPATVGPQNWTWRLPRPVEELDATPSVVARLDAIARLVEAAGR